MRGHPFDAALWGAIEGDMPEPLETADLEGIESLAAAFGCRIESYRDSGGIEHTRVFHEADETDPGLWDTFETEAGALPLELLTD